MLLMKPRMPEYKLYINTIFEMIERIQSTLKDKNDFLKDYEIQDATLMRLQVIGENIKRVPSTIKKVNKINWRKFEKLRNLISHKYNSVDYEIVWNFIEKNLPKLKEQIELLK